MFDALFTKIRYELITNRRKNLVRGLIFIVAGILIATVSANIALPLEAVTGAALLLIGVAHLVWAIKLKPSGITLLCSAFFISAGLIILYVPQPALVVFVTFLAILMSMEGFLEVVLAFRYHPVDFWGWILLVGFITLVMATFVWISIPALNVAALNWIIAANLILYGLLLLMLVWQTKY